MFALLRVFQVIERFLCRNDLSQDLMPTLHSPGAAKQKILRTTSKPPFTRPRPLLPALPPSLTPDLQQSLSGAEGVTEGGIAIDEKPCDKFADRDHVKPMEKAVSKPPHPPHRPTPWTFIVSKSGCLAADALSRPSKPWSWPGYRPNPCSDLSAPRCVQGVYLGAFSVANSPPTSTCMPWIATASSPFLGSSSFRLHASSLPSLTSYTLSIYLSIYLSISHSSLVSPSPSFSIPLSLSLNTWAFKA
jgi:hypothetical protein